jgi:hypothetical protein
VGIGFSRTLHDAEDWGRNTFKLNSPNTFIFGLYLFLVSFSYQEREEKEDERQEILRKFGCCVNLRLMKRLIPRIQRQLKFSLFFPFPIWLSDASLMLALFFSYLTSKKIIKHKIHNANFVIAGRGIAHPHTLYYL